MTGRSGRRWPPAPARHAPAPGTGPAGPELPAAIGDLSRALAWLAPGRILASASYQLGASGQASEQYRAPYQALAITSLSNLPLIITADTPKAAPPGPGPGSAIIPPRGFTAVNLAGYTWTIYGGSPGDQVSVQALTRPVQPVTVPGPTGSLTGTPAFVRNTQASPGAGQIITQIPAASLTPGQRYLIEAYAYLSGTPADPADTDNFALNFNGQQIMRPAILGSILGPQAPGRWAVISAPWDGTHIISITAIGAGTLGAVYHAVITATPVIQ